MSIESETKMDLPLNENETENIVGGRAVKASHRTKIATNTAAVGAPVVLIPSSTEETPGVTGADEVDIEC
jgi:hypothetical protein